MTEERPHAAVCAIVLAGGHATRMGGVDKGLQPFLGQPLVAHALHRLNGQSRGAPGLVAINANRNLDRYGQFGVPVWADLNNDFDGPLAGLQTAFLHCMAHAGSHFDTPRPIEFLLTVPCDSPLFPPDLLTRLHTALIDQRADIAIALAPELQNDGSTALRPQPVFACSKPHCESALKTTCPAALAKSTHGCTSTAWHASPSTSRTMLRRPLPTPIPSQNFTPWSGYDSHQPLTR